MKQTEHVRAVMRSVYETLEFHEQHGHRNKFMSLSAHSIGGGVSG